MTLSGVKIHITLLLSGLYRRLWNFTKSVGIPPESRAVTAGGEFHPAPKTFLVLYSNTPYAVCQDFLFRDLFPRKKYGIL